MVQLNQHGYGLRIEGIPSVGDFASQALFWHGAGPISGFYHPEQVLVEIPASLDAAVDLASGRIDLQSTTFALSANEDICRRFLVNGSSVDQAELISPIADNTLLIHVRSRRPITFREHLYIGDETLFVTTVDSVSGNEYALYVTRGAAGSTAQTHGAGARVAFTPPYMKWRSIELIALDFRTGTHELVWHGLIDEVATDDQQTAVIVSASDTLSALWGAQGGAQSPMLDYALRWASDGAITGSVDLSNTSVSWPNPSGDYANIRVGDVAYMMKKSGQSLEAEGGSSRLPRWDTFPDVDPRDDGSVAIEDVDEDITPYLAWSREGLRKSVANDLAGVYGVGVDAAHPAAVALALLLSTGDGANNLVDPATSTTRTFDVLGSAWGMAVPAKLIDAESWLRVIDEVPATIDQIVLGWGDPFDFDQVVLRQLLVAHNFYPYPTDSGTVGLRHMSTWSIGDMSGVLSDTSTVTLNPTRIKMDLRLKDYNPQIKATIGGMVPEEEPDKIRTQVLEGYRRDAAIGQTPHELDLSTHDKLEYRRDRSELQTRITAELEKRRDNPPIITCELPRKNAGGSQVLPPVLSWVRVDGGPIGGLIGPDGVRVDPADTQITFIGVLVGRSLDLDSKDAECRILLSNWWLGDRVPRLIAPAARVYGSFLTGGNHFFSTDFPSVDGSTGFSVGDQIQLLETSGRRSYLDPGDLIVHYVDGDFTTVYRESGAEFNSNIENLLVALDKSGRYSNDQWDGSEGYSDPDVSGRRFAYLADEAGGIDTPSGTVDADIYA